MANKKYVSIIKQVNAELKDGQVLPDPEPTKRKQSSDRAYIAEVVRIYPARAGVHGVDVGSLAGKGKQTIIYI